MRLLAEFDKDRGAFDSTNNDILKRALRAQRNQNVSSEQQKILDMASGDADLLQKLEG